MTKKQRREYKLANQARKVAILKRRGLARFMGGVVQDGGPHCRTARQQRT